MCRDFGINMSNIILDNRFAGEACNLLSGNETKIKRKQEEST